MTSTMVPRRSAVGVLIAQWRHTRRLSQLALAGHAQVSARHLSFVESGRATPSRDVILTLAAALDVPLRERNRLLLAGGYAPLFHETALAEPVMAPVRAALDRMLRHHEPYPAVVMDRHWNLLAANASATAMFGFLLAGRPRAEPANVLRLMFSPHGLRPFVANFAEVGPGLIQRAHREAVGGTVDEITQALLAEVLGQPGIPAAWRVPDPSMPLVPVVPVTFARDATVASYFSMVTTVGTPQDVTTQEIRVECFFPVDGATEEHRWT